MTIDERLERLAIIAKDRRENINTLTENINSLARIAENHERRITRLEGGE
jgi:hypothetical protein